MIKSGKIMSLALAFSIFAAQTVQAEVLITPLDPKGTVAESQVSEGQEAGNQADSGETGSAEAGQGNAGSGQTGSTETGQGFSGFGHPKTMEIGPGFADSQAQTAGQTTGQETEQAAGLEQPVIAAEAGILYDATHDRFLFEKNADEKLYPASITKIMTALLVLENAKLDETVTFSKTAVTNLESGAVSLGVTEGDQISVKDCMYGLLLKSANEVANGLAEHVGGSVSGFADRMNERAAALGCTNTHFVNPNGLNDPNHYTTAKDMARIAKAAFENPTLCEIASTVSYKFPATKKSAARTLTPGHKMLYSSDSRYYPGIVGGKTGYTSLAGNTLVTCVEKDGVRLIAVVLKSRSTHYEDTKAMLDYGFALTKAGYPGNGAGQKEPGQPDGSAVQSQTGEIGPGVPGSGQTGAEGMTAGQTRGPGAEMQGQKQ